MNDRQRLEKSMAICVRDIVGSGYVTDYYHQLAADFVSTAEQYAADQVRKAKEEWNPPVVNVDFL